MIDTESLRPLLARHALADADWTVGKVTDLMLDEDVSTVLIVDGAGRMIGLVSESVLLSAALDPPRQSEPISLYMERHFVSAEAGDSLPRLVATFVENEVRHLPILERGRPVGVISRRKLLQELASGRVEHFPHDSASGHHPDGEEKQDVAPILYL